MPGLGAGRTKCLQYENPLYFTLLTRGGKHLENKYLSKKSEETKSILFQICGINLVNSKWFPEQEEYGKCQR